MGMTDREKVIKALELCTSKIETRTQTPCETCPYHNRKYHGVLGDGCCNARSLQRDTLALLKSLSAFKEYFDGLYGQGLDVANYHLNGATEPFDNFYDSAMEEYENARCD